MARAGRRARQRARRRTAARAWLRARQEQRRRDDEQSQASEWSEPDESDSDDSLMRFPSNFENDEIMRLGMATLDSLHFEAFEKYIFNDRFRKAVKLLATCPNGVGLFEAKLRNMRNMGGLITFLSRRDGSYRTLLHHTAAYESEPRVTEVLLRYGANVNARDGRNLTPLHLAAKRANERTIACLLEHGAIVDARDDMGRTPLILAAKYDHKSNCEALIAAGADVEDVDLKRSWGALHYALRQSSARCVAPLLDAGATLDSWALDIAMMRGSTRGLYHVLRRNPEQSIISIFGARSENTDYICRVHVAGGIFLYQRNQQRKLVSLLRRHVAPRAPDDVLHVIVGFWGHPGSY